MAYTPPSSSTIHFDFTLAQITLNFNFTTPSYSPPSATALHFNFTIILFPLDFEFAPEIPPPISKELLLSLAVRLSGTVYKYWTCYIWRGKQHIRRYWEHNHDPSPWTAQYQTKFALGVKTWQGLDESVKIYWGKIGVRKKRPLPGYHAFLSAWLKDQVNPDTLRHKRNLAT